MAKQTILRYPSLWVTFLIYTIIPWIQFEDLHLLMFNFEHHRLEIFFTAFEASIHQQIYIIITIFIALLVGLNLTLSRFYCGYFCPSSLATLILQKLNNPILEFFIIGLFAFILAFSTIAYFTPAYELAINFTSFPPSAIFVGIITTGILSMFLVFRGWYCSILCPYYFVSAILPQEDKQTFELKDKDSCINCDKCVKICPVDNLDIKNGFDIRCLQCGLCDIACEDVMLKHNKKSLIGLRIHTRTIFNSFSKYGRIYALLIYFISIFLFVYILDSGFLDFCYFENKGLHK